MIYKIDHILQRRDALLLHAFIIGRFYYAKAKLLDEHEDELGEVGYFQDDYT
jgi:hypothetical protein